MPQPIEKDGGAREDRTPDLVIANDALSQLSYGPICKKQGRKLYIAWGDVKSRRVVDSVVFIYGFRFGVIVLKPTHCHMV